MRNQFQNVGNLSFLKNCRSLRRLLISLQLVQLRLLQFWTFIAEIDAIDAQIDFKVDVDWLLQLILMRSRLPWLLLVVILLGFF